MILADDEKSRRAALAKLLPMQRQDFVGLFEIMAGLPVTIRLLDPPLHEFLPKTEADMEVVAKDLGVDVAEIEARAAASCTSSTRCWAIAAAASASPIPEIYEMQARAIFEARGRGPEEGGQDGDPRGHDPAGRDARRSSTS